MINHFFGKVVHSTCIKGDVIDIQVACHLGSRIWRHLVCAVFMSSSVAEERFVLDADKLLSLQTSNSYASECAGRCESLSAVTRGARRCCSRLLWSTWKYLHAFQSRHRRASGRGGLSFIVPANSFNYSSAIYRTVNVVVLHTSIKLTDLIVAHWGVTVTTGTARVPGLKWLIALKIIWL